MHLHEQNARAIFQKGRALMLASDGIGCCYDLTTGERTEIIAQEGVL